MNRKEYESAAREFRTGVEEELRKPPEEQELPHKWLSLVAIATCRTPGCPNEGMSWKTTVSEPLDNVYRVLCGMCCHGIEELDPMFEDDEDYRLPVSHPDGGPWWKGPSDD